MHRAWIENNCEYNKKILPGRGRKEGYFAPHLTHRTTKHKIKRWDFIIRTNAIITQNYKLP